MSNEEYSHSFLSDDDNGMDTSQNILVPNTPETTNPNSQATDMDNDSFVCESVNICHVME